jgi:hypothetical protein
MPLPNSGPLSLQDIQTEFGGTNPISINEYYAGGALVPAGSSGINGPIPSSGTISINQFYGAGAVVPFGEAVYTTQGTYTFVVPSGVSSISAVAVGATAGTVRGVSTGGGALSYSNGIPVTAGEGLTVQVGTGGITTIFGVINQNVNPSFIARGGTTLLLADKSNFNPALAPGLASNGVGGVRYSGGTGRIDNSNFSGGTRGAGGAAGYAGNGGAGGIGAAFTGGSGAVNGGTGFGGAGGGGGGSGGNNANVTAAGGGVGIYGQGANGTGGTSGNTSNTSGIPGGGGSGGTSGSTRFPGIYGGGAGCDPDSSPATQGAGGAVRIIWGGGKSYPNNAV